MLGPGQFDAPTAYDLHFRLFGFPVRVHPLFWVVSLLFMYHPGVKPSVLLVLVAAVFVSILIHELGHALAMRWYGWDAKIVLYALGGYAQPVVSGWGGRRRYGETTTESIAISLAGPAAPAVVSIALMIGLAALGVRFDVVPMGSVPFVDLDIVDAGRLGPWPLLTMFLHAFLSFGLFWGFFNLIPVYPLDGGQIAKALLTRFQGRDGVLTTHWVSIIAALGVIALELVVGGGARNIASPNLFLLLSLAGSNFAMAQQLRGP